MWEAYDMKNEDFLWAAAAFQGGIGGRQIGPCGAVSAGVICLGLKNRCSLAYVEKARQAQDAAYEDAAELVKSFVAEFGAFTCRDLLGFDFSDEVARKNARESGLYEEKCEKQIPFVVKKLYELDAKRN